MLLSLAICIDFGMHRFVICTTVTNNQDARRLSYQLYVADKSHAHCVKLRDAQHGTYLVG
jgi:hypothetical protein